MEPHGQAPACLRQAGPIRPSLWGDIPTKRWRIPFAAGINGSSNFLIHTLIFHPSPTLAPYGLLSWLYFSGSLDP